MLANRRMLLLYGEGTFAILCPKLDPWWALVRMEAAWVEHFQLLLLGFHIHNVVCKPVHGNFARRDMFY